jgi:hypothetical protein
VSSVGAFFDPKRVQQYRPAECGFDWTGLDSPAYAAQLNSKAGR